MVNTSRRVVLDGRGKVTLSGGGKRRILYQDTCDKRQIWTTSHCDDQATPRLVVQNLTFANGNSTGETYEGGGGGAIFIRGGRLKIVRSRFTGNRCDPTGPDLGGAAVRALSQYHDQPVYVTRSTFTRGVCSNGAALSSIGVSWSIFNSVFTRNRAIGRGANPQRGGHARRRLRRRDLHGRQRLPRADRRHAHDPQPRERGRRRDLLRQQRPHRDARHPLLDAARTTRATASRTRPASSSSAASRRSRGNPLSVDWGVGRYERTAAQLAPVAGVVVERGGAAARRAGARPRHAARATRRCWRRRDTRP